MRLFWIIIGLFSLFAVALTAVQLNITARTMDRAARSDDRPTIPVEPADDGRAGARADADVSADAEVDAPADTFDADDEASLAGALVEDLLGLEEGTDGDEAGAPLGPPTGFAPVSPPIDGGAPQHSQAPPKTADNPWIDTTDEGDAAPRLKRGVVEQDDGSLLVDGVFELRGKGTEVDPYVLTWDYLMSAAETYQPRIGMTEIPERIQMLDGKHVKIAGYLLFPTAAMQAEECLVMLNMWDGCCIGVMPTPYDAIEVRLTEPVPAGARRYMNYGTIEGRLDVDPYLINDWLIGLYLMEGATLKVGM